MMVQPQVCRPPIPEFKNLDWISTSVDAIVVQNKWYTPFPLTKNVKVFYLIVEQTNNGAAIENLTVELTVNGTVFIRNMVGVASGVQRYMQFNLDSVLGDAAAVSQMLSLDVDQSVPLETKSLKIRVRQTSTVDGVAANIEVNMVYLVVEENATVVPLTTCRMYEYANLDWISTSVDAIVVQNKWYTPLSTTKNVKAFYLIVEQTNNGAAVEDIEVELTINGVASTVTMGAAINGTPHYIRWLAAGTFGYHTLIFQIRSIDLDQSVPLETKSLQIRVRQTTAVDGVAAQIEVNMVYSVKPEIQGGQRVHEYKNLDWIETTIVQNDWLTPLNTVRGIKAFYLIVEQTNNGAAAESIEVELTINGSTKTASLVDIASGSAYYLTLNADGDLASLGVATRQLLALDADQSAPLETKSLKIRVRQTTAVDGVSAQIEVNLVYEELQPTTDVLQQLAEWHYEYKNLDYDTSGIANPVVINDWYTALDTILDAKAWYLIVEQTNNGGTVENIDIEVTVDGAVFTRAAVGMVSGDDQYMIFDIEGVWGRVGNVRQILALDEDQSAPLETKTLKVRVRQTSVVDGVSAVIEVNMVYAQKEVMYR